jgi:predicted permease
MTMLWNDLKYAFRQLRKDPGFTAVAVLTLALGIGANTAIFSLVNAVMLRRLPVENPQELVLFSWVSPRWPKAVSMINVSTGSAGPDKRGYMHAPSFSYPIFERLASDKNVLASVFGFYDLSQANTSIRGNASLAYVELVTGEFFSGLGVQPILGRAIAREDDKPGAPAVAVIGHRLWREHFSADPRAVGQSITIMNVSHTIIGVAPAEFFGIKPGSAVDVWVPVAQASSMSVIQPASFTNRGHWWLGLVGRLKRGVTRQQACSALDVLIRQEATPELNSAPSADEIPSVELSSAAEGLDSLRTRFSDPLHLLFVAVGLVLLIACANVAGLLLARASTRRRDICVRSALGASRVRLVRQLLTESILLSVGGGALGLFFAVWGSHVLLVIASPRGNPIPIQIGLDPLVLTFTLGTSLVTAMLFGLAPALHSTHTNLTSGLKENPANLSGASRSRLRLRKTLVVAETAFSVLLLISAGLFVRTLVQLEGQDLGFNPSRLLLFHLDPTPQGYRKERLLGFYDELLGRIQALPGVASASLSSHSPLSPGGSAMSGFAADGDASGANAKTSVHIDSISLGFLQTMGIPIIAGREFGREDTATSPQAALINATMARQFFGDENPVGRWLLQGNQQQSRTMVVGVVKDTHYYSLVEPPRPILYCLYTQRPTTVGEMRFEVRTKGDPKSLVAVIRATVADMDRNVPLSRICTQEEQIDESLSQQRLFAQLSSFFGFSALLLVCIGFYGLMAYATTQRTHELGLRMALGARRWNVLKLVLRDGMVLALAGIAAGFGGAFAATRFLSSFLFGISATDPITFVGVAALLGFIALLANFIPARRATKVNPMVALRHE